MLLWGIIIIVLCMNNFISKWTHDQRVLRRSPEAATEKKKSSSVVQEERCQIQK